MPANVFFETGTHHVLCKIPGLDQTEFPYPSNYEDRWDKDHVRLPCSPTSYYWSEIVQGLTTPITNFCELSKVMARWNGGDDQEWRMEALEALLNQKADRPPPPESHDTRNRRGYDSPLADMNDLEPERRFEEGMDSDGDTIMESTTSHRSPRSERSYSPEPGSKESDGDAESDYFSKEERDRFFTTILPKMQALALRLPELVKKPIPLLKEQVDMAVTLSQEQIACLLAHAFFNTFPCRNTPNRGTRKRRPSEASSTSKPGTTTSSSSDQSTTKRRYPGGGQRLNQAPKDPHGTQAKTKGQFTGEFRNADGQMSLFAYFGKVDPKTSATAVSKGAPKEASMAPVEVRSDSGQPEESRSSNVSVISGTSSNRGDSKGKSEQPKEPFLRYPSINFWTLFCADRSEFSWSSSNPAKIRCIIHYFDRVTTDMPQGTVTFHRQVLKTPVLLEDNERVSTEPFCYVQVRVDVDSPLEDESPPGALQLDFANKVIGGGVLGHGAVQEEIRFVICPELIVARLFTQTLQENEALLMKGAERYSNYNGYAGTFTWHSNHVDNTPRDFLGRRKTEICAIDAIPFRSKEQRLRQFSRRNILRELNKAVVGFRRSPITASEWGLCRAEPSSTDVTEIATGNWGCGAFGGHLELKFMIQLLAASVCGGYSKDDQDDGLPLGRDMIYYTYGLEDLGKEIEAFTAHLLANPRVFEPSKILEYILHYPIKSSRGEIVGLPRKSLLDYIGTGLGFPSVSSTFSYTDDTSPSSLDDDTTVSPYFE
ncbi:hypothetical protein BGX34_005493 [Mortierella sp. NVP85]|nr:hypothetical protein BGX34_005493 [Mortierella sp. NVP85]